MLFNHHIGPAWRELRRFTIQALRDFGVGKTSIEEKVITEVDELSRVLTGWNRKPGAINPVLQKVVGNIILGIVFGRR